MGAGPLFGLSIPRQRSPTQRPGRIDEAGSVVRVVVAASVVAGRLLISLQNEVIE